MNWRKAILQLIWRLFVMAGLLLGIYVLSWVYDTLGIRPHHAPMQIPRH